MNWRRIWTGGLLAGLALFSFEAAGYCLTGAFRLPGSLESFLIENILFSFVTGTILCGLYVLARPRLGPGPMTALVMGSISFVLMDGAFLFNPRVWALSALLILKQLGLSWIKCVAATYIAGWQYIEKAP